MTMMMRDLENQEIGKAEGRKEGRAEGEKNQSILTAKDMLIDNKPIEEILKYSRLEPKDLKEVADSMNITVTIPGI